MLLSSFCLVFLVVNSTFPIGRIQGVNLSKMLKTVLGTKKHCLNVNYCYKDFRLRSRLPFAWACLIWGEDRMLASL